MSTSENISEEQLDLLKELKVSLETTKEFNDLAHDGLQFDDRNLLKFLASCKNDVERACDRVLSSARFRREIGLEAMLQNPQEFSAQDKWGSAYWHKHDLVGRPVLILRVCRHDPTRFCHETTKRYILWKLLDGLTRSQCDQVTVIVDFVDATRHNVDTGLLTTLIPLLQHNFPETLGTCFVYPTSIMLWVFWKLCRKMMDESTSQKLIFLRESKKSKLSRFFNVDSLQARLGGTCLQEFGEGPANVLEYRAFPIGYEPNQAAPNEQDHSEFEMFLNDQDQEQGIEDVRHKLNFKPHVRQKSSSKTLLARGLSRFSRSSSKKVTTQSTPAKAFKAVRRFSRISQSRGGVGGSNADNAKAAVASDDATRAQSVSVETVVGGSYTGLHVDTHPLDSSTTKTKTTTRAEGVAGKEEKEEEEEEDRWEEGPIEAGGSLGRVKPVETKDMSSAPSNSYSALEAKTFRVRCGPDYKRSKKKAPSQGPSVYELVAMDAYMCERKVTNIGSFMQIPEHVMPPNKQQSRSGLPELLIINFMMPLYEPPNPVWGAKKDDGIGVSIILFYRLSAWAVENQSHPSVRLWQRYVHCHKGDPFRERLKFIFSVENPNDLQLSRIEKALYNKYNALPFLIYPEKVFKTDRYFEMDLDCHLFCFLARKTGYAVLNRVAKMVLNVGIVVQAETDDEMPERMLCCATLYKVNLKGTKPIDLEFDTLDGTPSARRRLTKSNIGTGTVGVGVGPKGQQLGSGFCGTGDTEEEEEKKETVGFRAATPAIYPLPLATSEAVNRERMKGLKMRMNSSPTGSDTEGVEWHDAISTT